MTTTLDIYRLGSNRLLKNSRRHPYTPATDRTLRDYIPGILVIETSNYNFLQGNVFSAAAADVSWCERPMIGTLALQERLSRTNDVDFTDV